MSETKKRKHIRYFDAAEPEFQEVEPDANDFYDENKEEIHDGETDEYSKKWFQMYDEHTNDHAEAVELKLEELNTLRKKASSCFDTECYKLKKNNPSDNKWLLTAVDKGTSQDSANAGIVLVQSNPLSNLEALKKVVQMANVKNKTSVDVLMLIAQLFLESLLPAYRKLCTIEKRGADWKKLKGDSDIDQATKDKILAYWHFEDELKGYYGDFCNHLAQQLQHGLEANKMKAIHAAVLLLVNSPEREVQLLPMLINKFGDPNKKVTNKLLETLRYLVRTHSRMCLVISKEIEKLLFRNNTNDRSQHYALTFLSLMGRYCDTETAQVLVRICLAFFKIKTESGAVNSRTMQRILACFRTVITEAANMATVQKEEDLIDREVLEQLYRMIYLAQIETALYAMSLLLEINIAIKMRHNDRYYNMLYKKMSDLDITKAKHKNINLYFNILHRSIDLDPNVVRAQAFIKRLLQIALYWPSNKACGALVLISKVLKRRPAVRNDGLPFYDKTLQDADDKKEVKKGQKVKVDGYDWQHRNPLFAGAQYSLKFELSMFREHYHPTVRVFAEDILNGKPMTYYGDPIQDFHITRFLDRFSFRNPAKMKVTDEKSLQGSRKLAVKDLTDQNVVEEEKFLLEYHKNDREMKTKHKKVKDEDENDDETEEYSDNDSVNDEEFDAYLDRLGAAGGKNDYDDDIDLDEDLDFLGEMNSAKSKKSKKKKSADDESDGENDDWEVTDEGGEKPAKEKHLKFDNDDDVSDDGSISLDDEEEIMGGGSDDDDDDSVMSFSDDDLDSQGSDVSDADDDDADNEPKKKRQRSSIADEIKKKMKFAEMDSDFVGTDEFAEMLESSSKSKNHGTSDDVHNHDKSSAKQMKWESGRMQDLSELKRNKFNPRDQNRNGGFVRKNNYKSGGGRPGFDKKSSFKPGGGGRSFGKKSEGGGGGSFKKSFKKSFKPNNKSKNFKNQKFSNKTRR